MSSRSAGATLIEVLVALFLMGLALMAAAPMFMSAVKETASGADLGSVGARAVDRMELLRQSDFPGLVAGGSLTADLAGYSDTSDPDFMHRWEITDNATPATLKTISVRVIAARQVMGLPKEIILSGLRAR